MNVSKIGLGTVQFGLDYGISNRSGKTNSDEVKKILSYAEQNNITYIDTAYGYGESETVLGDNDLSRFNIITKFLPENQTGQTIENQLSISLNRLNQTQLYAYLSHRPMELLENKEIWERLNKLKEDEFTKKIGFSLNHPDELKRLLNAKIIPDIVQIPFNLFDQRFLPLITKLKEKYNCEIHSRSTFLQGLFFMNTETLNEFFDPIKHIINRLQEDNTNLAAGLLNFVLEQKMIDRVILGVTSIKELKENIDNIGMAKLFENKQYISMDSPILSPSNWPKK